MDQALLVEQQIDDGQEFFDLLISDGFDVSAAAWVKPSEEDRWLLYLVSKVVDDRGLSAWDIEEAKDLCVEALRVDLQQIHVLDAYFLE